MRRAATKLQPFEATTGIPSNGAPCEEKFSDGRHSEQQPARGLSASLTLFAMSLGYGVVQLDVTIVNTALDRIGASLGGGVAELQWIVNAYTIAFAAFILTAGALGDRIGAKRVFMAGFAIFTSASLACALSPNPIVLVAARAVQGLGAAVLVPNSLALLNHAYPDEKRRGRAVGIWAAGASLALTAGPLVGGALIALIGWRSIFLVNLPIGLAGLWLSWKYATETSANRQRQVDLPGQVTAIAALGCLAGAIIEGGALGWSNGFVLAAFVASVALAVLFILQERRAEQPMLPLSLFGHRLFALTSLVGLLVNIAFYGLIFVFSLYFQRINGLSPVRDRSGVRADDGRGAAGQSGRCPRDRTAWCANDHCARCGVGGFRVLDLARHRAGYILLEDRWPVRDHGWRPGPLGAAAHFRASGQRR